MSGVPETIFVEAAVVADTGGNESKSIKKNLYFINTCACAQENALKKICT